MKESIRTIRDEHRSPSSVLHALFSRLVALAPAPVGLGEPWKKLAAVD